MHTIPREIIFLKVRFGTGGATTKRNTYSQLFKHLPQKHGKQLGFHILFPSPRDRTDLRLEPLHRPRIGGHVPVEYLDGDGYVLGRMAPAPHRAHGTDAHHFESLEVSKTESTVAHPRIVNRPSSRHNTALRCMSPGV